MTFKRIIGSILVPVFALGLYTFPQGTFAKSGGDVEVTNNNFAVVTNYVSVL